MPPCGTPSGGSVAVVNAVSRRWPVQVEPRTVSEVTRYVVALVAVLTTGCGMIEAGEVEGPPPAPSATTTPAPAAEPAAPSATTAVPAVLVDEATGTDIAAELDAMEADLAALDELLADEALEGMEP